MFVVVVGCGIRAATPFYRGCSPCASHSNNMLMFEAVLIYCSIKQPVQDLRLIRTEVFQKKLLTVGKM